MAAKRDVELVRPYLGAFNEGALRFAQESGKAPFDVALLAAVCLRETWGGTAPGYAPRGPDGAGDGGHGRGLFQVDDRGPFRHYIRPAPWPVEEQARVACVVLEDAQRSLRLFERHPLFVNAVLASYNAGAGRVRAALLAGKHPDVVTTPGEKGGPPDYSKDVLATKAWLRATHPTLFPLPASTSQVEASAA